jgi:hypothetical protein
MKDQRSLVRLVTSVPGVCAVALLGFTVAFLVTLYLLPDPAPVTVGDVGRPDAGPLAARDATEPGPKATGSRTAGEEVRSEDSPHTAVSLQQFIEGGRMGARSYTGRPVVPGLTTITPRIVLSRTSGYAPLFVHVSADVESDTAHAYTDLHYEWNFGDAAGVETFRHPVTGQTVSANTDQTGPEAFYVYRNPGSFTIRLKVKGWNGTRWVCGETSKLYVPEVQRFGVNGISPDGQTTGLAVSGGTWRMGFNGEWTRPLGVWMRTTSTWSGPPATRDDIEAALEELPSIGKGNVRIYSGNQPVYDCTYDPPGGGFWVEFRGRLLGRTVPFLQIDNSQLMGGGSIGHGYVTPPAGPREHQAQITSQMTVLAWDGLDRYIDPQNGNDANPGTLAAPKQTIGTFFPTSASKRRLLIRCGSTLNSDAALLTWREYERDLVVTCYDDQGRIGAAAIRAGSARPIWQNASTAPVTSPISVLPNNAGRGPQRILIEGIEFRGRKPGGAQNNPGLKSRPMGAVAFFYFAHCKFAQEEISGQNLNNNVSIQHTGETFGQQYTYSMPCAHDQGFYACEWDGGTARYGNLLWAILYYRQALFGCTFRGRRNVGSSDMMREHHVYAKFMEHFLARWCDFGAGRVSSGLKLNLTDSPNVDSDFSLIEGCNFSDTAIGLGYSATAHYGGGLYPRSIVSGCTFHDFCTFEDLETGVDGDSELNYSIGIAGHEKASRRLVVRDTLFYNVGHQITRNVPYNGFAPDMLLYRHTDDAGPIQCEIYRCQFYKPRTDTPGFMDVTGAPGSFWIAENTFWTNGNAAGGTQVRAFRYNYNNRGTEGTWFERNRIYTPNQPTPFYNAGTGVYRSVAQIEAEGLGRENTLTAPTWTDPTRGDFRESTCRFLLLDGTPLVEAGQSRTFRVRLGAGTISGSVTVTPSTSGLAGSFNPPSIVLDNTTRAATFTFTPAGPGLATIRLNESSGSLTVPPALSVLVRPSGTLGAFTAGGAAGRLLVRTTLADSGNMMQTGDVERP